MKKKPFVSVLIPVYNVEKYLAQCMDSVVNQTLKNIEIICINDGSTDSSLEILREYAEKDDRIRIIDKKNSGYGNTMNRGIVASKGEYIGIVESDDFAEPDMFEKLYNIAKTDNLDVARSNFYYYTTATGTNAESNIICVPHYKVFAPSEKWSTFYQQPSVWANIYRASFIKDNDIRFLETPGASYQDTAFTFKVYAMAERFEMISDALIHYRIDGGSSSFQTTTKVYCVSDEYNEIKRFIKENDIYDKYRQLVPHLQYNGYRWNYNRLAEPYDQEFLKRWREEFREELENGNISRERFSLDEYEDVMDIVKKGQLSKAKVSVIIPVYNMELFLRKCLDSVVNQTLKEIEIICVNDGSKDSSLEILQEYASKDKRIKIISKENGGQSSARNVGMKSASARFIGFVDADDWIEQDTYETALKCIKSADIAIFGINIVGDVMLDRRKADEEYYRVKNSGLVELNDRIRLTTDVSVWNKLFRRSIIEENKLEFPEGKIYEDYSFYWYYIFLCKKAYFDKSKKYNYLRRDGSTMCKTFGQTPRALEHLEIFKGIYEFLKSKDMISYHKDTVNSMFLNCFWFAYMHSPVKIRQKVLELGTEYVIEMDLTGNEVLDNLRLKRYNKINIRRNQNKKQKLMGFVLKVLKKISGKNLEALESTVWDGDPIPYDVSRAMASTKWVHDHENFYGIKRWSTIYDSGSEDPEMNWGFARGISGGNTVESIHVSNKLGKGMEYRALISLWGVETAIINSVILSDERSIGGTSMFDGKTIFTISLDVFPKKGFINVYGRGSNGVDYSKFCKIIRIEKVS